MSQAGIINVSGSLPPSVPITFVENVGSATAAANILNVLGAGNVVTSGSGNTITILGIGSGINWNVISTSQVLTSDNGYFCVSPGGALLLTLPATSVLGDQIEISLDGATSFSVTQAAGQSIRLGSSSTTIGAGGSLTTTAQGDTLTLVCQTANLKWNVISSVGNFTVV